ncbi:hypothetical protein [Paractinoplanes brasiliensis]|uniref:Uncharacterized protein n=1 Tax=Paractinoplanes brasiliensis TaxID=52695 RepID=A0A4R6JYW4_9ACTN|nr:hypothetical protein [Actinoplanes brasiliensis]TDO40476.1 hypothetical protein C8E87_4190 [Actinoplanes brasiliensis]GID25544.1 hypothetical protein Abr02nite_05270 [Actinoplanes brasiliensis]
MAPRYDIRVRERPGELSSSAFLGLSASSAGGVLRLSGEMDQSALHGVLERIRFLGLELIDVRRTPGTPRRPALAPRRPSSPDESGRKEHS